MCGVEVLTPAPMLERRHPRLTGHTPPGSVGRMTTRAFRMIDVFASARSSGPRQFS